MQAAVLIQPTPDLSQISVSKSQEKVFEKAPRRMNPSDRIALEAALLLQDKNQLEVTTLCLAGAEGEKILREALALGAKKGVLLSDGRLGAADPFVIARVLAAALRKLGAALIFAGPGQVGPRVAEEMKAGLLIDVNPVDPPLPPAVRVVSGGFSPRMANPIKIMKAAKAEIIRWDLAALGLDADPPRSAVVMRRSYLPPE
jgi:electron transfer flavoprotein alpha/beta subunit